MVIKNPIAQREERVIFLLTSMFNSISPSNHDQHCTIPSYRRQPKVPSKVEFNLCYLFMHTTVCAHEGMLAIGSYVDEQVVAEQKSNQQAAAIMGVILVGAAAASCANTNCYGGGYNSSYVGNCPCPYSRDVNGNLCGARSAYGPPS